MKPLFQVPYQFAVFLISIVVLSVSKNDGGVFYYIPADIPMHFKKAVFISLQQLIMQFGTSGKNFCIKRKTCCPVYRFQHTVKIRRNRRFFWKQIRQYTYVLLIQDSIICRYFILRKNGKKLLAQPSLSQIILYLLCCLNQICFSCCFDFFFVGRVCDGFCYLRQHILPLRIAKRG